MTRKRVFWTCLLLLWPAYAIGSALAARILSALFQWYVRHGGTPEADLGPFERSA